MMATTGFKDSFGGCVQLLNPRSQQAGAVCHELFREKWRFINQKTIKPVHDTNLQQSLDEVNSQFGQVSS